MKKILKVTSCLMVLILLVAAFASCNGGGSNVGDGGPSIAGETKTWGNITVLVPDGMKLTGGATSDKDDPDSLNIAKKDKAMNFFFITLNDNENVVKALVETNKSTYKGVEDVSVDAGGTKFTGVTYDSSGTKAFYVYGKIGSRYAIVQSNGFELDSDKTKAILGSIKVKA